MRPPPDSHLPPGDCLSLCSTLFFSLHPLRFAARLARMEEQLKHEEKLARLQERQEHQKMGMEDLSVCTPPGLPVCDVEVASSHALVCVGCPGVQLPPWHACLCPACLPACLQKMMGRLQMTLDSVVAGTTPYQQVGRCAQTSSLAMPGQRRPSACMRVIRSFLAAPAVCPALLHGVRHNHLVSPHPVQAQSQKMEAASQKMEQKMEVASQKMDQKVDKMNSNVESLLRSRTQAYAVGAFVLVTGTLLSSWWKLVH